MGWFDEQIKQRKISDQEVFEESFAKVAGVVLGKRTARKMNVSPQVSRAAIDDILQHYHFKPVEIPSDMTDIDDQLEYALRPHAIMRRNVKLDDGWYKDAFGPMLGFDRETGNAVALLPYGLSGYYFTDFKTGKRTRLNARTAERFEREAICFYKSLPSKKLKIWDLVKFIKGCIGPADYALVTLATLLAVLLGMIGPKLSRILTGPVLSSGSGKLLIGIAIFMFCTIISSQLIAMMKSILMGRLSTKTSLSVEAAVMMRIMSLPPKFFRQYSSGDLAQRASAISSLCRMLLSTTLSTGLTSVMSLIYISQISTFAPSLVLPSLLIIFATVLVSVIISIAQVRVAREMMKLEAKEKGLGYAFLTGIQKIKLSGAEKRAFAKWTSVYAEEARCEYNPPVILKIGPVIITAISLLGTILLYFVAARSGISVSDYFAFNAAYGLVLGAFSALSGIATNIASLRPILEMCEPILKEEPETTEGRSVVTSVSGKIELSHVFFRYNEGMPYVINNLSLKIDNGEYVAIVGKTGCGKSTLMRLLLGFETPEKGAIYYDNREIRKVDLKSLRRKVGAVMQNGSLLSGSIYENISVSSPGLSLEDAWKAAELAGIADDIKRMPMGMMTVISEGQGGFSGGQKQRLMIARALAPKPKILMFDEATSALDNRTQKQVSDALDNLKCTRIVIAHRLSTIKNCDRIILLDGGRIVEDGTYDELIARNGLFADLVERQRLDRK